MPGCSEPESPSAGADLILTNGRVYSLAWADPDVEGVPSVDAPYRDGVWSPDAGAIAVRDGLILAVGSVAEIDAYRRSTTRVMDLEGATAIPGLIESHGHYNELGEQAERIDVSQATSTEEMAEQLQDLIASTPPGEWIVGGGWDEGAWADALPTNTAINRISPATPVVLLGRRGFGLLANQQALEIAGISMETPSPSGGEVVKGANGEPTGVLLNRARALMLDAIPAANLASKKRALTAGLNAIAAGGYVTGHHAGVYADYMPAYESLAEEGALPIRVEVMLAARPENRELVEQWIVHGPTLNPQAFLQVRSVKAYYDGSLGSRGAKMLAAYSDQPGHTGTSGDEYGFPEDLVTAAISAGFQVGVHAIGDAGNRAVLDFYERVLPANPHNAVRHRIEHAQIIHADDFARFGALQVVASMEPCHAVEDSPWAEDRVGSERIKGGYAWRTLRRAGAGLIFNSDLAGTDFDIFYGLHCAVTRTDREGQPAGGWYPEQAVTIEEALRAYTVWPARASSREELTGTLESGKWADITVLSIDPFAMVKLDPAGLIAGEALMTIVAGQIVHNKLTGAEER
jgi:predicted amidohydrolase YtcJ